MAEINKKIISQNFSKSAHNYQNAAILQKTTAHNLVNLAWPYLQKNLLNESKKESSDKNPKLLDLGCGTGFVISEILDHDSSLAQKIDLSLCDIAPEMLQLCQKKFPQSEIILGDFEEKIFSKNHFQIITSSFSMQWTSDFERFFSNIFQALTANGIFIFAIPTQGSLAELKQIQNVRINEFPRRDEIQLAFEKCGFVGILQNEEKVEQSFPTKISALKFLKEIGANSSNESIKLLKKSDFAFSQNKAEITEFKVSWLINYFIIHKKQR